MAVLVCCGLDGLLADAEQWQPVFCPLPDPALIAIGDDGIMAVVDNSEHLLWLGDQLFPVDSGIECLRLWHGRPLLLSGDTDCLTLLSPSDGTPLVLTPAGVYPQDMCLLPGNVVAVCGGDEGTVYLFRLPDMQLLQRLRVPGSAQRLAWYSGWLYALCAVEDDALRCLLCRINLRRSRCEVLHALTGLPGALHADEHGLWVAASENLCRFRYGESRPAQLFSGFGLIRRMVSRKGRLLLSDPVLGTLFQLEEPCGWVIRLLEGDVGQAAFL